MGIGRATPEKRTDTGQVSMIDGAWVRNLIAYNGHRARHGGAFAWSSAPPLAKELRKHVLRECQCVAAGP